jgi:hypothetical protein
MANPHTTYPQYDVTKDSSYPPLGAVSARNMNGGRRYKKNTMRNKKNIKNGGNYAGVPLGTGPPVYNSPFFSTVSSSGALSSESMFTGNGLPLSSEVYDNKNYIPALV